LYKTKKLPAWTPEEIKGHPYAIRSVWARTVRDSRWGRPVIARIMLRNELGREPTTAEVGDRMEKLGEKTVKLPPPDVVRAAFEKGEEKLHPWKLECKGYEEELQWEIVASFPHYKKAARKKYGAFANT